MSEQLLKALMQLFAIIARPESNRRDRRSVVESFLLRQLNRDLADSYLNVFDDFYQSQRDRHLERGKRAISSSSVKVLKICTQINEELTNVQKIIVLYQLFEFVKSDGDEVTAQELEFIKTVADIFHIPEDEYWLVKEFVLTSFLEESFSNRILIINDDPKFSNPHTKHIYRDLLEGEIRVLHVESANMFLLRYIGKKELALNGQLLQQDKVNVLDVGSSIRNQFIKPIYYSDIISTFYEDRNLERIAFKVRDIEYRFKNGKIGLQPLSFSEESGRLVGIMGASGAGKSTLLNVLNGSSSPTAGEVTINGVNIHTEKSKIDGLIGHVSQDDLLIEELSVYQNLYYNAKLCFDNYTEEKLIAVVDRTLQSLGLYEIRDIQVGSPLNKKISGGQRKRLNIALELIREPAVLFLDEPTSGLSSRDSENIMDLLKELALKGKLVFVVIHQPSSDIFKMFDKLIILDTGGYLIYNGDPIESIIYFKERINHVNAHESECHVCGNVNPEQIFNIVEANVLDEYGKITPSRKITPKEWGDHYKSVASSKIDAVKPEQRIPTINFKIPGKFKQFLVFITRDIFSKLSNTQYLVINFLEAPLLAFILAFIVKYYNISVTNEYGYTLEGNSNLPVYIFMSVIVAIFMGLTVSAEEIIKDRKILKRESFLNLSRTSYLLSKVAIMFILSALQAALYVIVGNTIIELKGMYFHFWLVLFSAWASANMMGLVISDTFKTVVTIYILIPFLVIPQIILSGVIVKYEKLNPSISSPSSIPWYGEIITSRWAYEALAVHQFMENKYMKNLYAFEKWMSRAEYKRNYWLPNLQNKVDILSRVHKSGIIDEHAQNAIELLKNEIIHENEINNKVHFSQIDELVSGNISEGLISELEEYLDLLRRYYIKVYNNANNKRDEYVTNLQKTAEDKENFLQIKRQYSNEQLTEFVENKNEVIRIIEFDGKLYQKTDPIYMDPEFRLVKAHFYAPQKQLFGHFVKTFWVNVMVIWCMTFFLYMALYYRWLKKFIEWFENSDGIRKYFNRKA